MRHESLKRDHRSLTARWNDMKALVTRFCDDTGCDDNERNPGSRSDAHVPGIAAKDEEGESWLRTRDDQEQHSPCLPVQQLCENVAPAAWPMHSFVVPASVWGDPGGNTFKCKVSPPGGIQSKRRSGPGDMENVGSATDYSKKQKRC